ncbi:hypothetical protein QA601_02175 [Chitinispirillales bacterium ANBcel5]|uniref:hypothetical protein n=1 Tax=Cellulosispirillum alkaliphilum TaxID=3039283 RepID=UPI002A537AC0|nr:hypothetical protein [Chitinispirillales bacterium ANBcel5]
MKFVVLIMVLLMAYPSYGILPSARRDRMSEERASAAEREEEAQAADSATHKGVAATAAYTVADSAKDHPDTAAVLSDSVVIDTAELQRLRLVKREFDHRSQVRFAIGMMVFVAAILGSSQSWNPR